MLAWYLLNDRLGSLLEVEEVRTIFSILINSVNFNYKPTLDITSLDESNAHKVGRLLITHLSMNWFSTKRFSINKNLDQSALDYTGLDEKVLDERVLPEKDLD